MARTRLEFLDELNKVGMNWQLCISKTTELSTCIYFETGYELHNFLATFFSDHDAERILHHDGIWVVNGVQYSLYRV